MTFLNTERKSKKQAPLVTSHNEGLTTPLLKGKSKQAKQRGVPRTENDDENGAGKKEKQQNNKHHTHHILFPSPHFSTHDKARIISFAEENKSPETNLTSGKKKKKRGKHRLLHAQYVIHIMKIKIFSRCGMPGEVLTPC